MLKYIVIAVLVCTGTTQGDTSSGRCGRNPLETLKLRGSKPGSFGRFPWEVTLKTGGSTKICGSLIHPSVVLATVSDAKNIKPESVTVSVTPCSSHESREPTMETSHVLREVKKILVSEDKVLNTTTHHLVLFVLSKSLEPNDGVTTVCLPDRKFKLKPKECFIRGVLNKTDKSEEFITSLKLDRPRCSNRFRFTLYGYSMFLDKKSICPQSTTCIKNTPYPATCRLADDSGYVEIPPFWNFSCDLKTGMPVIEGRMNETRSWIETKMKNLNFKNSTYIDRPNEKEKCGKHKVDAPVMNGTGPTNLGEYPWMAAILDKNKKDPYICGGSLIHPSGILTLASCVDNKNSAELTVRVGEWDMTTTEEHLPQDRGVLKIKLHENYNSSTQENNYALLFLSEPIILTDNTNTICRPEEQTPFDNTKCFVSGWGPNFSDVLKQVQLSAIPLVIPEDTQNQPDADTQNETVTEADAGTQNEEESQTDDSTQDEDVTTQPDADTENESAAEPDTVDKSDFCMANPGSPVVCAISDQDNRYLQVGIVSGAVACEKNGGPNVFERIDEVLPWVEQGIIELEQLTSPSQARLRECGTHYLDDFGFRTGPKDMNFKEFPWQVSIQRKAEGYSEKDACSGTLIHPRVVLTNAHCVGGSRGVPGEYKVKVASSLSGIGSTWLRYQEQQGSRIISNEEETSDGQNFVLLILSDPLFLDGNVHTVCLTELANSFPLDRCFVSGRNNDRLLKFHRVELPDGTFEYENETDTLIANPDVAQNLLKNFVEKSLMVYCTHRNNPSRYIKLGSFSYSESWTFQSVSDAKVWIDKKMTLYDIGNTYVPSIE